MASPAFAADPSTDADIVRLDARLDKLEADNAQLLADFWTVNNEDNRERNEEQQTRAEATPQLAYDVQGLPEHDRATIGINTVMRNSSTPPILFW